LLGGKLRLGAGPRYPSLTSGLSGKIPSKVLALKWRSASLLPQG
jgi:hypothetical protein